MASGLPGHRAGSGAFPPDDDPCCDREVRVWGFPPRALFAATAASLGPGIWRSRCPVRRALSVGVLSNVGLDVLLLKVMFGSPRLVAGIDNQKTTAYNSHMSSLGQPSPVAEERDSSRLIIGIAVFVVIAGALAAAFLLREPPKAAKTASPYIANLKLSDFKMSAAENFIGHTVSYIDGSISNTGDKTVTRVMVEVNFLDSMGQLAQREELPLRVIRTNGAYNEPVDLNVAPLGPGQSAPYRLTFDSISQQWNRQYPQIRVTDVT